MCFQAVAVYMPSFICIFSLVILRLVDGSYFFRWWDVPSLVIGLAAYDF